MNLRSILGLVAALGTAPTITSCATAPKPIKQPSVLEQILATPQTEKKITVFYEFVKDEMIDKKVFTEALSYVKTFYKQNGIEMTFKQSSQLETEALDGRAHFGIRYAGFARLVAEMLQSVGPVSEEQKDAIIHMAVDEGMRGSSFREKGYVVVSDTPDENAYCTQIADKWRWMRQHVQQKEYTGEIPNDGEARLFALVIGHELGHLFGLSHPPCTPDKQTTEYRPIYGAPNLMSQSKEPEISIGNGQTPFTTQQPFGAYLRPVQRAIMHSYLGGGIVYDATKQEENYEAWLTKNGMPACDDE